LESAGITGSFFVCTTPRTGSTMLVYALAESRQVGLAAEHFNPLTVPSESDRRIGDHLLDCTGKAFGTGVFGTKLHWSQVEPFVARLRRLRGTRSLSDGRLLEAVLPAPRYLWLTRDDKLAQAVSWWRAKVTRVWLDDDEQVAEPVFDFDAIDERLRMAHDHDAAWQRWFDENGITPHRITYEELVADPAPVVRRALAYLGVDAPAGFAPTTRTRRQADSQNDEWMRRYRELAERR
jgi:LPS sulfotransferase NodH